MVFNTVYYLELILPDHYALQENRSLDVDLYIEKLKEEIELLNCKLCFISSEVFTELIRKQKITL